MLRPIIIAILARSFLAVEGSASTSAKIGTTSENLSGDPEYQLVGVVLQIRHQIRSPSRFARMTEARTGIKLLPSTELISIKKEAQDQSMEHFGEIVAHTYRSIFDPEKSPYLQTQITHSNRWETPDNAVSFGIGLTSFHKSPWYKKKQYEYAKPEWIKNNQSDAIAYDKIICPRYYNELQRLKKEYLEPAIVEMKNYLRENVLTPQQISGKIEEDDLSMKMVVSSVEALYNQNPSSVPEWASENDYYFVKNIMPKYRHAMRLTYCQTNALMQALIGPIMEGVANAILQIASDKERPVFYAHIGHDQDLFAMMLALNRLTTTRNVIDVAYGATLALEVFKHASGQHFIEASYAANRKDFPTRRKFLQIETCEGLERCPIEMFLSQVRKFIPESYEKLCESKPFSKTPSKTCKSLKDERVVRFSGDLARSLSGLTLGQSSGQKKQIEEDATSKRVSFSSVKIPSRKHIARTKSRSRNNLAIGN